MFLAVSGSSPANFTVPHSVRFYAADSAHFTRTPGVAGSTTAFTFSAWIKLSNFGTARTIFASASSGQDYIRFDTSDRLEVALAGTTYRVTARRFRDPGAWLHVVVAVNVSNGTVGNRILIYINGGAAETSFDTNTSVGTITLKTNSAVIHSIGRENGGTGFLDGYMANIQTIDGQQLTAASFGELNSISGVWTPKKYTGSYGTNGFHLDFIDDTSASSSALGKDRSGNNNDWTPSAISVGSSGFDVDRDVYTDVPTTYNDGARGRGNFCTLNALDSSGGLGAPQLKNGALEHNWTSAGWQEVRGTIGVSAGKWYWEATVTNPGSGSSFSVGIRSTRGQNGGGMWWHNGSWSTAVNGLAYGYKDDAQKQSSGTQSAYGVTFTTGDVIGIALDLDAGTLTFYKNNVSQGSAFTGLTGEFTPGSSMNVGAHVKFNFGQRAFKYTPPTNHLALCTQNLPTPAVIKSNAAVDAATYVGTGAIQSIASMGFSPDLVWIKSRAVDKHVLFDTTRGVTKELYTNTTGIEATIAQGLTAFNSNGFSLGTGASSAVNTNAVNYVVWAWNDAPNNGVDIKTYTGNSTAGRTIAHDLNVVPRLIIVKNTTDAVGRAWSVYHADMNATPQNGALFLNLTDAYAAYGDWNNTAPTSGVFSVGGAERTNITGSTYIAYLFAEVAGFSKIGKYTGDATANGPFVYCGFRPRFILIKRVDSTGSWQIQDSVRYPRNLGSALNPTVFANLTDADTNNAVYDLDFLANGFKIRSSTADRNASAGTYVFAAFAEAPLKFSRAA